MSWTTFKRPPLAFPRALVCTNAEPGTYGHECGKPADYIALHDAGRFYVGRCAHCAEHGAERDGLVNWQRVPAWYIAAAYRLADDLADHWGRPGNGKFCRILDDKRALNERARLEILPAIDTDERSGFRLELKVLP